MNRIAYSIDLVPCYLPFYGRVLAFLHLLEVENE